MLRKIKLLTSDEFQHHYAVREMSSAISRYLDSLRAPRALGSEQGGFPEWDDVVIETADGVLSHRQVKRQTTAFCTNQPVRDAYTQGGRKGAPRDLSALDKTMAALADLYRVGAPQSPTGREFWLVCPSSVEVKQGLTLSHVAALCAEIKIPAAQPAAMATRTEHPAPALYQWLTTWCAFDDWDHIFRAFRHFSVELVGDESALKARTEATLEHWFVEPGQTRVQIFDYLRESRTDLGAVSPRDVLLSISDGLRTDRSRWIRYRRDDTTGAWRIAGTCSLPSPEVEVASLAGPSLWDPKPVSHHFQVEATWRSSGNPKALEFALLRLGVHIQQPHQTFFVQAGGWRLAARTAAKGTLGSSLHDLDGEWLELSGLCDACDCRTVSRADEIEAEFSALSQGMDSVTWKLVATRVGQTIRDMPPSEVRSAIEELWIDWSSSFSSDTAATNDLFQDMMHVPAEGASPSARVRVGPRTVPLLAKAILINLVAAAALGGPQARITEYTDGSRVRTVALNAWWRPALSRATEIFSEGDRDEIMEALSGSEKVNIFAGTQLAGAELYRLSLAEPNTSQSLATTYQTKLIITPCVGFNKARSSGSLAAVREYLGQQLKDVEQDRANRIASLSIQ